MKKFLLIIIFILFSVFPLDIKASTNDVICPNDKPTEILIYFHGLLTYVGYDYAESLSTFTKELNQIKEVRPGVIGVHPKGTSGNWGAVDITSIVNDAKNKCNASEDLPVAISGHSAGGGPLLSNPSFPAWKIILLDAIYSGNNYSESHCGALRIIDGNSTQSKTPALVSKCNNSDGFVYVENKTSSVDHFATRSYLATFYLDSEAPGVEDPVGGGNNNGTNTQTNTQTLPPESGVVSQDQTGFEERLVPCGIVKYPNHSYRDRTTGEIYNKPTNNTDDVSRTVKDPCNFEYLLVMVNRVIQFMLVGLALPIAAIAFAYAGFLMITSGGNTEQRGKALGVFKKVGMGLVISVSAWLIVSTLLSVLGFDGSWIGFK